MRLVLQRVKKAQVELASGGIVGQIGPGLLILVGVGQGDDTLKAKKLAEKVSKIRLMADKEAKMNLVAKEFLVVSQFTLLADTKKGNRPSFIKAANPEKAKEIYEFFIEELKTKGVKVETGSFGNYMQINSELNGPVTIILEE